MGNRMGYEHLERPSDPTEPISPGEMPRMPGDSYGKLRSSGSKMSLHSLLGFLESHVGIHEDIPSLSKLGTHDWTVHQKSPGGRRFWLPKSIQTLRFVRSVWCTWVCLSPCLVARECRKETHHQWNHKSSWNSILTINKRWVTSTNYHRLSITKHHLSSWNLQVSICTLHWGVDWHPLPQATSWSRKNRRTSLPGTNHY